MIKLSYLKNKDLISCVLEKQSDAVGSVRGPLEFTIPAQPGNSDFDDLQSRIESGELEILPYEPPVTVPETVHDYQFAGQAAAEGIISFDEAMAWTARGEIPTVLLDAVEQAVSDPDRRMSVKLFLAGSKDYPRHHPLTPLLGPLLGKEDDAALDAFWVAAAAR